MKKNDVVATEVSGTLTEFGYDMDLPTLIKLFTDHPGLRFFIILKEFNGVEAKAREEVKFSAEQAWRWISSS